MGLLSLVLVEVGGLIGVIFGLLAIFEPRLPSRIKRLKWPCGSVGLFLMIAGLIIGRL
jgi:hypothetical protein